MDFQEFKDKYEYIEVEEYVNYATKEPLVSICVMTYNQVSYIKDCLNSILMQETDFLIEILLGEDDSTDGTREVCLEYAQKNPEKIRLFLHRRENNIKIDGKPSGRFNFLYNLCSARGKYIALCEGDDYWTDPLKLQKQVDFLEKNQDCSLCFHPSKTVFMDGSHHDLIEGPKVVGEKKFSSEEIIERVYVRTATMLFRVKIVNAIPNWFIKAPYGDYPLQLICASMGNAGYMGGMPMGVYRRGTTGAWSEKQNTKNPDEQDAWKWKRLNDHLICFDLFNEHTAYQYSDIIEERKRRLVLRFLFYFQDNNTKLTTLKMAKRFLSKPLHLDRLCIKFWLRFILGQKLSNRIIKGIPRPF